ncbi:PTS sugar transporter subunit IIA [Cryobacterium sp. Y11]|uniref:PTS sugar transporter subunit IIA n=1 Tax=Cryobacterium sp. Y11 TaxID=2045016 RepID=UPI001304C5A7|nr:fructose PTS transporter subunit IIA [Cryobacterium sp. Y11]
MELSDLYDPQLVVIGLKAANKNDVFTAIGQLLVNADKITNIDEFLADVQTREATASTGVGEGLAIPHAKSPVVKEASYAIANLATPFNWDEDDDEPTTLIVMLAVPSAQAGTTHLKLLSRLSVALMDEVFRAALVNAKSEQEISNAILSKEGK